MKADKNLLALAGVCLSSLMFGLEISSVPVILPVLQTVLDGTFSDLQWIMNAYTIACTTVLMAVGILSDRYGRKLIFLTSVALFGLSSLACGLANSAAMMIIFRTIQGMSGGAMVICQIATLSLQFREGKDRAFGFSCWGIIFGIGLGFGPLIGAGIVALMSWQWVFLVHVILAVITFVLIAFGVRETKTGTGDKPSVTGMVTLSLTVLSLTYFITHGSANGFANPITIISLLVATGALLTFISVTRKSANPLFDFSTFRIPAFTGAILGSVGMNISFWPFMIYIPVYFQTVLGYDSTTTGLSLLAYSLPTLLSPPIGECLALRYHPGKIIPAGLLTIGAGFFLMWLGSRSETPTWITMLPGLLIAGTGLGATNTTVTNTSTGAVTPARAGMASGIDMSARMITLAVNIVLLGFIIVEGIVSHLKAASGKPYSNATLHELAQHLIVEGQQGSGSSSVFTPQTVNEAIAGGFGYAMIYCALGVTVTALLSFISFNRTARTVPMNS